MKVCKFGGSSLANADQIRKACDIIVSDAKRRIVVVSAPGKRNQEDIKITDLLITLAELIITEQPTTKALDAILKRFVSIAREMHLQQNFELEVRMDLEKRIDNYYQKLNTINATAEPARKSQIDKALTASLKAAGEDNCARLVAAYLNAMGEDAEYISPAEAGMILTGDYDQGQLLPSAYEQLSQLKNNDKIIVIPGFFGVNEQGEIITFSRGGSDITGAILAAAVQAEMYENWSDVDSVFAVNPNLVSHPAPIREMTYNEMRELAYAGFTVLHEETLEPVMTAKIPLSIRNTNNRYAPGTKIVSERHDFDGIVTGITGSKSFCFLQISEYLMNKKTGFVYKILGILNDLDIPFDHMPSGIDSITIVMRNSVFTEEKEAAVRERLLNEIGITKVRVERDLAIVMIVGAAMAQTVGVMSRAANALGRAGINIEFISQGAAELSIIFGVRETYSQYAVKELYHEFFKGRES